MCIRDRSLTLVYCDQTVGRNKMKLGKQVGLGPGHIVLDGDPAPSSPRKETEPLSIFGPCLLWPNGCMDQDAALGIEVGLGPGHNVLDWDPASLPNKGAQLPVFGPCLLCPNGWMDQDATEYKGRPRPRPHCVTWGPSSPSNNGHSPAIFGTCLLWPNGRLPQLLLSTCFTHFNALYVL